jgi:hypothetical protein
MNNTAPRKTTPGDSTNGPEQAIFDVIAERHRQIWEEGFTEAHDDEHANYELARAAACYMISPPFDPEDDFVLGLWPWGEAAFKPRTARENLVRAGALILAEIERLDRAALLNSEEPAP